MQVERLEAHRVLPLGATQMDAVVFDILDVFRPGVDQDDILTGAGYVPADVPPTAPAPIKIMRLLIPLLRCLTTHLLYRRRPIPSFGAAL